MSEAHDSSSDRLQDDSPGFKVTYLRLLTYLRPSLTIFVLGALATVIGSGLDASLAWMVKPLVDTALIKRDISLIHLLPVFIAVFAVVRSIISFLSDYLIARSGRNVVLAMRYDFFSKLMHLQAHIYDETPGAYLIAAVVYNIDQVASAATEAILVVLRDGGLCLGLLVVMFSISWQLTSMCLVVAPLVAWVVVVSSKRMRRYSHHVQASIGELSHITEEAIRNFKEVRLFNASELERSKFYQVAKRNRQRELRVVMVKSISASLVQASVLIPLAIALSLVAESTVTTGSIIAVILAVGRILQPLKRLAKINAIIQKGIAAAEKTFHLLAEPVEVNVPNAIIPTTCRGALRFEQVSMHYPSRGTQVLHHINLTINPGEKIALIGKSGSGKSSLVKVLLRFYDINAGAVYLDNHDIRDLDLQHYRQQFSFVGQDIRLFNDSVLANITYGADDIDQDRVVSCAKAAHAHDFIAQLPDGYGTVIGDNGVMLSGGQKQRLAIARAFYKDARLLILDEATSALDSDSERAVQNGIEKLLKGRTAIMIAHRLSTIRHADRMVVLDHGRVVEEGTHDSLMAQEKSRYKRFYQMQNQVD